MTTSALAFDLPALPGRPLSEEELKALVGQLADRPELWQNRVAFDTGGRHFASLYRDGDVDIWLLCWNTVDDTGWHDHDTSSGAVAVVRGAVREAIPRLNGDPTSTVVEAGSMFSFGPEHIHRMSGAVDGSVSIHATRHRCGGWGSTRSEWMGRCADDPSVTPMSYDRWIRWSPSHRRRCAHRGWRPSPPAGTGSPRSRARRWMPKHEYPQPRSSTRAGLGIA